MTKIDEAKEYLQQVYKAKQVCLRCNADLEELRATSIMLIPSYKERTGFRTSIMLIPSYKERTGFSNIKHDTSDFISKLEQQEEEMERLKLEWLNKRIEIKSFLNNINMSENIKNVLILRYVSLRKWEEIACSINCSFRWVHTLHSQGSFLNNINMSENIKNVLILRYVSLRKWEEIACSINCSFRWVHTLHSQGLSIVAKKIKN